MRIAFIVHEFPVFSETFLLEQIVGLLDRGCEVDIYAHQLLADHSPHRLLDAYDLRSRARQLTAPDLPSRSAKISRGLRDLVLGVLSDPRALAKAMNPFRFGVGSLTLRSFYRVAPFLARNHYDLVHCHFGPNGLVGVQLRQMGLLPAPIVTQFHGFDASSFVREKGSDVYRVLFNAGQLFLCVSERIRERLIALGCPASKLRIHHAGVDLGAMTFHPRPFAPNGVVRILTVGRLVEKKGIEFGLRAIADLLRGGSKVEYTIAGAGPEESTLRQLCRTFQIESAVTFTGSIPHDRVVALLNDADVMLAPSVTASDGNEEGIPVVLMEALATGLPVVSTFHAGIPELVTHGVTGLLSRERDAQGFANQIRYLMANSEMRERMIRAGRLAVEHGFDNDKINSRLYMLYQELCGVNSIDLLEDVPAGVK
jgi:colanic acid/amylovoran biosynthesis glycosyltransferase